MSRADLTSVRAKLAWATRHFNLLDAAIAEWLKAPEHPTISAKADLTHKRHALIYDEPRPKPIEWSLIAGDFLQNLRSTLDHLVAQIVTAQNGSPAQHHAFPIALSHTWWLENVAERDTKKRRRPGPLDGIAIKSAEWQLIAEAQPYIGRNATDARRTPLAQLARLNNTDKHRELNLTTVKMGQEFSLSLDTEWQLIDGYWPPPGTPIEPGQEFGWLKLQLSEDHAELNVEFPIEIAFDNIPLSDLRAMFEEVKRIVVAFEPLLV